MRLAVLLLLCACGTAAPAGAAAKYALMVGIDRYPFVRAPELQLHGAKTDLEQMGLVLRYGGFQPRTLEGAAATGSAMRQALRELADRVGAGDEVFFYFSGRGSVAFDPARPDENRDLEPTLVPYDGQAQSGRGDLPMRALEAWARDVTAKGAAATLLLDTCYSAPASRGEDRFYKNVPRCVRRPGTPRRNVFNGPGTFMAATVGGGQAYEWRVDFSSDTWAGAFTDLWTNAAMRRLKQNEPTTFADLMGEVHRFFAARPGYMRGMRPHPAPERLAAAPYQRPLPAPPAAPSAAPAPAAVQAKVDEIVGQRVEQAKTLRVALEASPLSAAVGGADRSRGGGAEANPALLLRPLGDTLKKQTEMVTIVPEFGDRPDRIVVLARGDGAGGWVARVQGDEVDASRQPEYRGKDVNALLKAGLAGYLQRQAYVLRLFRLSEHGTTGAAPADWSVRSDKPAYRPGERLSFVVRTAREGLLYLFDQDEKDGIVQMVFPLAPEADNRVPAGETRLPRAIAFEIPRGQSSGRTTTRAILVTPAPSLKLPPLPKAGAVAAAKPADYEAAERDHLRALVRAIEKKQVDWAAVTFEYRVAE